MDIEARTKEAMRITVAGAAVNTALLLLKAAAGLLGNSQAMVADAVHTFSDLTTDLAVVIGMRFASKPRDADHAYGHGKYEAIAAAVVGIAILLVAIKIAMGAMGGISALLGGTPVPVPSPYAFWVAIASIVVKELLYRRTVVVGDRIQSAAVLANAWHHRSDALSSLGTAAGIGMAVFLGEKWVIMDSIAALLVSLVLLKVACTIIHEQMGELADRALPEETCREIEEIALRFPHISHPHNLRTRMVGRTMVLDLHVRVDPDMRVADAHAIITQLESRLCEHFGDSTLTCIHIEPCEKDRKE